MTQDHSDDELVKQHFLAPKQPVPSDLMSLSDCPVFPASSAPLFPRVLMEGIPAPMQKFGFVPDTSTWEPGDLVLVAAAQGDKLSKWIRKAQRGPTIRLPPEHARWEHSAIYLGDLHGHPQICEADTETSLVRIRFLYPYLKSHLIRIRHAPKMDTSTRSRLVASVFSKVGLPYNWQEVLGIGIEALIASAKQAFRAVMESLDESRTFDGDEAAEEDDFKQAYFCSQLYAAAYCKATGSDSFNDWVEDAIVPGYLSRTTLLEDREPKWMRLPPP